jgi:hypothetical protein
MLSVMTPDGKISYTRTQRVIGKEVLWFYKTDTRLSTIVSIK